jgi:hypothetical protein
MKKTRDGSSESRGQENKTVLRGKQHKTRKNNNAVAQLQDNKIKQDM